MAIQIPIIDDTRAQAGGIGAPAMATAEADQHVRQGTEDAARGIDQAAQGWRQSEAKYEDLRLRAKEKADEIAAANALTQLQSAGTKAFHGDSQDEEVTGLIDLSQPQKAGEANPGGFVKRGPAQGFLSTRGEQAIEYSGPTFEGLQKTHKQLLASLNNPEQKAAFERHAAGLMEDYHRQLETHVSQQIEVADQASVKALEATALVTIRNSAMGPNPEDLEAVKAASGPVEALRKSRALSPEDEVATKAEWRSKADLARLDGAMVAKNWPFAQKLFAEVKDQLGSNVDIAQLQKTIQSGFDGAQAQDAVDTAIEVGTSIEGRPNLKQIDEMIAKVPAGPVRDEIERRLGPAKQRAEQRWKEKIDSFAEQAGTTFEKTLDLNAVDPTVKVWLQNNAPDEWKKLRHDAEAEENHRRARHTGNRAAISEQHQIDERARLDFINDHPDPADRAAADVDAYLRGRGVSPLGLSRVKLEQTKSKEAVDKGEALGEAEFVGRVKANTAGILGVDAKGKPSPATKQRELEINAAAVEEYQRLRIASKGKPSPEEVAKSVAQLALDAARPGSTKAPFVPPPIKLPTGTPATKPTEAKVEVRNGGQRGLVPASKADAWLAAHLGWSR